ncbi:ATP-binding protein [Hyphococcus flavus]|uniref:Sensory/regulatory protein RpfC n=1 Tax=Hyphococcus flavus TaxID=1866326 RepID=A0AAE9ZDG7_9PROT|nr:ATP-binding protein [Hyphococcus flavus]WDI30922.1 ATP-binding protein [Hyphococcus flavus]
MEKATPEGERASHSREPSVLSALIATALTRRHQLVTRYIIAAIGAGILWGVVSPVLSAAWFLAIVVSQVVDDYFWKPFRDEARTASPSKFEWISLCASAAQATVVYSALPAMLWWLWDAPGKIFAMLWLSGALLHVTMHMHHEKRTFIAAIVPHAMYFFGLPIYSLITGLEPGRVGSAALLLACLLYVSHLVVAFREYQSASKGMRLSREEALKRQAVAEQASEAKSAFLANMSHEIRTPMNGILGMASALETEELTSSQREKVQVIQDSGDLMLMLLNDLLDLSKIEANKIELDLKPFAFSDIARKVESLHSINAKDKGLAFSVECECNSSAPRLGDGHRILQVLHNLVANAIKFTERGSVRVKIVANESDVARIEVADTGIGITKEQAARIFEPFTQADASTTRKYGGTGLGLSIAKGLVEAMGGEISVRSKAGEGSRFIVEIPVLLVADNQVQLDTHKAVRKAETHGRLKILAGEDNAVNQAVLSAFLKERRHEVYFAADGLAVVDAFKRNQFDIVLMDISMPVLDGPEALRQIRFLERESGASSLTPVIAVSAHAMPQQVEEYLSMGFNGYVTKPIRSDSLHGEIERVLSAEEQPAHASSQVA